MDLNKFEEILASEPKFRIKQVYQAVFRDCIDDFSVIKTLPAILREKLNKNCFLSIEAANFLSKKGDSEKALITLSDGEKIETVLMRHKDLRNTVCVSSQVGCPMNCAFCATGKLGLKRNLTFFEILEQVLFFQRKLKKEKADVTNVVFMGMGEPLLNLDAVLSAIKILNDKDFFNIGARKISVSTCGIVPGIKKIMDFDLQINLALSLHAPTDELRSILMPVNKNYPLSKVFDAINEYIKKTNRKVMMEYLLIGGMNDSLGHAKKLADLLNKYLQRPFMVNLIPYNYSEDSSTIKFRAPNSGDVNDFRDYLVENGVDAVIRHRFGADIAGACGQLALKNMCN